MRQGRHPTSVRGNVQKSMPSRRRGSVQQGRSHFDARSVLSVRKHGKRARTPLAAFFNITIRKNDQWTKTFLMKVSYEDFVKLDLRIAKIDSVEPIPGKSKIVKGVVELGSEKRVVIIGGAEFYQPKDLIGKTVVVVANLEPKKLAGIESNAMLLAADVDDKPYWLTVVEDVPPGTKIK